MKLILPTLQKTGLASEDPNLPIDENHIILQVITEHQ